MQLCKEKIILASKSPRRQELLRFITSDFEVLPSLAAEDVPQSITAAETAEYLAALKAGDVAQQHRDCVVIGADTCVIAGDMVLGKPKSKDEARQMLRLLSGKAHKVITGCAIIKGDKISSFSVTTEVEFYPLSDGEIEEYISTDEPYDKAGGYGIQGKACLFVKGIAGDYFNVVGLPVAELNRKLNAF